MVKLLGLSHPDTHQATIDVQIRQETLWNPRETPTDQERYADRRRQDQELTKAGEDRERG
jgi:hypothetical protein